MPFCLHLFGVEDRRFGTSAAYLAANLDLLNIPQAKFNTFTIKILVIEMVTSLYLSSFTNIYIFFCLRATPLVQT